MTFFEPDAAQGLRQAFVLGLSRKPLPKSASLEHLEDKERALAALSLIGQNLSFSRPPAQTVAEVSKVARTLHDDARPLMPDTARRALVPILAAKKADDLVAQAVLDRCRVACVRMHPFDLPDALRLLRLATSKLGAAERAFLALADGATQSAVDLDQIAHWLELPKADRLTLIRLVRSQDPDRARTLIADSFAGETADLRASLIEALAMKLGTNDVQFLESAASDRAAKVREAAQSLLGDIPGTAAYAARVDAAMASLSIKKGVLGLGRSLVLAIPTGKKASEAFEASEREFRQISIDDIAHRLKTTVDDLVDLTPSDESPVTLILIPAALTARKIDEAARLAKKAKLSLVLALRRFYHLLTPLSVEQRSTFLRSSLSMEGPGARLTGLDWRRLCSLFEGPTTTELFDHLLAAPVLREDLSLAAAGDSKSRLDCDALVALVALAQQDRLAMLNQILEPLPPALTQMARALLRFALTLPPT